MILLFLGRLLIFLLILNHRKAVFALFIINILFILSATAVIYLIRSTGFG